LNAPDRAHASFILTRLFIKFSLCLISGYLFANSAPSDINVSNLTIAENSAIGTVIGEFNATDPDGDTNITFSLPSRPTLSSLGKLKVWLDASGSEQLSTSLTDSNPPISGNQIMRCRWWIQPHHK